MGDRTHIQWTDATWNVVTGCVKISDGCTHCYIDRQPPLRIAGRKFDGDHIGATTGVKLHSERLGIPLKWRDPRKIFVCSLSDLFQDQVPDRFIAEVWAVMSIADRHTFQVLTKRHARLRSLLRSPEFWAQVSDAREARGHVRLAPHIREIPNAWIGVTIENQDWANRRIPALIDTPAAVRWLSCEPLLGPIDLNRTDKDALVDGGIDWIVCGGESGAKARLMAPNWARGLRDQAIDHQIPYFFKQWGEYVPPSQMTPDMFMDWDIANGTSAYDRDQPWRVGKKRAGRLLDGRTWDEYPQPAAVPA